MRLHAIAVTALALVFAGASIAADKAEKQAETKKAAQATVAKFYKAQPRIEGEVKAAPGYAVFTTYGLSFLLGGAGGAGIAHDKAGGKDVYMNMAQASAGPQAGVSQTDMLIVFKSKKALDDFINKGWEFGGGGSVAAGAGGKSAGGGAGEQFIHDAKYYTLTRNGLEAGGNLSGTKFWKDKDMN